MTVSVVKKEDWVDSWQMHRSYAKVFHEERSIKAERPDFALICSLDEKPLAFVTCIEMDSETLYWQFGGAFDEAKRSLVPMRAVQACLNESKAMGFKRVRFMVENSNLRMLKLALGAGFVISGTYFAKEKLFVELLKELGE